MSFDGEQFTIAGIEGSRVMLRRTGSADGRWRQVDLVTLLTHPGTRLLVQAPEPQPAVATLLGGLDGDEDDELTARLWHVARRLGTGYQHGCAELALDGEPRPEYAPGVPMMARYQAKAAELGVGVQHVCRRAMQAQDGPAGLVTRAPGAGGAGPGDPRWLDAARQVIERYVPKSLRVRGLLLTEIEEACLLRRRVWLPGAGAWFRSAGPGGSGREFVGQEREELERVLVGAAGCGLVDRYSLAVAELEDLVGQGERPYLRMAECLGLAAAAPDVIPLPEPGELGAVAW